MIATNVHGERTQGANVTEAEAATKSKRRELLAFLFLTVVLAPAITVAIVGGYGFAVWMYQLIAGPPGSI